MTKNNPTYGELGYTDHIRQLAEVVRLGRDDHAGAEALRDCAGAIEELEHRINMLETWLAGTGDLDRFEKTFSEWSEKRNSE